nr:hypothetical protein [Mycolicibacterium malmesburyense]
MKITFALTFSPIARRARLRARRKMLRALGPERATATDWSSIETGLPVESASSDRGALARRRAHYLEICHSRIDRSESPRVLEIGRFYGAALEAWQKSLPRESTIVIIDVSFKLAKIAHSGEIYVRVDEDSTSLLRGLASEYGPFDVILDVGTPTSAQTIALFRHLYTSALTEDGVYLVDNVRFHPWAFYNGLSVFSIPSAFADLIYGHYQVATGKKEPDGGPLVVVRRATD